MKTIPPSPTVDIYGRNEEQQRERQRNGTIALVFFVIFIVASFGYTIYYAWDRSQMTEREKAEEQLDEGCYLGEEIKYKEWGGMEWEVICE